MIGWKKEFTYEHVDDLYRAIETLCAPLFTSYPPDRENDVSNLVWFRRIT